MKKKYNSEEVNILFYGYEIGGQMQLLAEKMRQRYVKATAVASNRDFRGYQNDICVAGKGKRASLSRFFFFIWALFHYDVFHFFWGVSLWSFWRFHLLDLPILKLFGKTVIVHFRGLDVVDIKYFDYKREKARGENVSKPQMSRPDQLKNLAKWKKNATHILVSEPDLHFVSDKSILSPQVIDMAYWTAEWNPKSKEDGIFRIVHAPSSRRKKGTDFIEAAIEELKARGHKVELVLAEKLAHHKVRELYSIADLGIDQVLYGWHGKVSVEMMAVGLPTICHIDEVYLKYRPELPIVDGHPGNLVDQIEILIKNPQLREEISLKSKSYVAKYHDVEVVIDDLFELYGLDKKTNRFDEVKSASTW